MFQNLATASAILLPIKSLVAAVFWTALYEEFLKASAPKMFGAFKIFLTLFITKIFDYIFAIVFTYILAKDKNS